MGQLFVGRFIHRAPRGPDNGSTFSREVPRFGMDTRLAKNSKVAGTPPADRIANYSEA